MTQSRNEIAVLMRLLMGSRRMRGGYRGAAKPSEPQIPGARHAREEREESGRLFPVVGR